MRFTAGASTDVMTFSRDCPILLVGVSRVDPRRLIRQRPLQRPRLIPRRTHSHVALFVIRQDHRHGVGVNRLNCRVRRSSRKQDELRELVLTWCRDHLCTRSRFQRRQTEAGHRSRRTTRHPSCLSLGWAPARIRRSCWRDQTAAFRFQPTAPVRRRGVADVGDGKASRAWRRHAPPHHGHLALRIGIPDRGRGIVRNHAGHRRKVADIAVHDAHPSAPVLAPSLVANSILGRPSTSNPIT